MTYQPDPIDTSKTALPESLGELEEKLARHNHDVWARQRLAEGWQYGPKRDDQKKEHPCLVPYDQLPESEKQYDRQTSAEAIKAILVEGYCIEPPTPEERRKTGDSEFSQLRREIEQAGTNAAMLLALWQKRSANRADWEASPEPYALMARRLLSIGAPLVALEIINEGLLIWEKNLPLRQLKGLAFARTGSPKTANAILQSVRQELESETKAVDPVLLEETLGILARTHKDLGLLAVAPAKRHEHLKKARDLYQNAYERTGRRYWTGINAATLSTLLGETELAQTAAGEVRNRCAEELKQSENDASDPYWILATLGEAELNLGNLAAAEAHYRRAAEAGEGRFGDLNSTRRQCKLILKAKNLDHALADRWLPLPGVAVFSGHMIDQPGRPQERFPARFANAVKQSIREWMIENNVRIGFSSAACGSDLLFLEVLQELGGECHVILPYEEEQFVRDSVNITGSREWGKRFRDVLGGASQLVYTSSQKIAAGSVSYNYANLVLHGLATVRARELETEPLGLVVWNGARGDGPGGTASVVARWHGLGVPIWQVDLSTLPDSVPERFPVRRLSNGSLSELREEPGESETEVMAMLFADAVNFARLTEEEVPRFVESFLGEIARIVRKYDEGNVVKNTWGDGLYLVFKTVRDAGCCALEMREMVQTTDWKAKGLPKDLALRIALHAGPVFGGIDPVTGNMNYTGTHVSRAARLEPKTPPGAVYASEAFAALVAVDQVDPETEFACEYIKQLEWAKHYGTFPTYVVRKGAKLDFKRIPHEKE